MDVEQIKKFLDEEWFSPWTVEKRLRDGFKKSRKGSVIELGRTPMPTRYGDWTYIIFGDYATGKEHDLLVFGELPANGLRNGEDMLLRLHSSCRSSELFNASNCECKEGLETAMKLIAKEKNGAILYLNQEGAGNGSSGKLKVYSGVFEWHNGKIRQRVDPKTNKKLDIYGVYKTKGLEAERRNFEVVGEILKYIGVKSVRLLTNNPHKIKGIESAGIKVTPIGLHIKPQNKFVRDHLKAKADRLGHKITKEDLRL